MTETITLTAAVPPTIVEEGWQDVGASFERFCLTAGIATLTRMMEEDAVRLCGPRYGRGAGKQGHRWGRSRGKIGFHGGKVAIERPRVRAREGGEVSLPSWEAAQSEDWLGRWATNLMLINVSTRRFGRAVRLPEGDVPAPRGSGVSKSATSRRFVALTAERMAEWMSADLSKLDLLAIQIDGLHLEQDLILLAAVGIDSGGIKHPLGLVEGATENAAVVQALLDNLVERGLNPTLCRLFIVDGAKALIKAIRKTFGRHTPIQRCQVGVLKKLAECESLPQHLAAIVGEMTRCWGVRSATNWSSSSPARCDSWFPRITSWSASTAFSTFPG